MKVISWNLLHGQPVPPPSTPLSEADSQKLFAGLHGKFDFDILGLQEVDDSQPRSSGLHQIAILAQTFGANAWAYAPTVMGTPGESWRTLTKSEQAIHTEVDQPSQDASYGIGLVSKVPVTSWHHKNLGRSLIGLPLLIPTERGVRFIYVKDEPRVALAAVLENGYTVCVTHLSFVPIVNYLQLQRAKRWLRKLPGKHILIGDLNMPWNLPVLASKWRSLQQKNTYPSWGGKVQFDYITVPQSEFITARIAPLECEVMGISDHLPIGVEIIQG